VKAAIKRVRAVVHGRVQGVGFRYFTMAKADRYGCTGWVRNMPDGTVEFEAQGPAGDVDSFALEIRNGPSLSHVSELMIVELPVEEKETGFELRI
jgi:acylphosphatase